MKNKIESRSEFKTNIKQNPFKLLKVIKEHLINYHENKNNMFVIFDAQMTLFTTKQREEESWQDTPNNFELQEKLLNHSLGDLSSLQRYYKPIKPIPNLHLQLSNMKKNNILELTAYKQYLAFI